MGSDRPLEWAELQHLAEHCRIIKVERTTIPSRTLAHMYATRQGLVARLQRYTSQSEYQFSFAHEIAHTAFFRLDLSPPELRVRWTTTDERLVDRIARALLLPQAWIAAQERAKPFESTDGFSALNHWAKTYRIPLWQVVARCAEAGWSGAEFATKWRIGDKQSATIISFAHAHRPGDFIPLSKHTEMPPPGRESKVDAPLDPNAYVWPLLKATRWLAFDAHPRLASLRGEWRIVGRGNADRTECVCLYFQKQLIDAQEMDASTAD